MEEIRRLQQELGGNETVKQKQQDQNQQDEEYYEEFEDYNDDDGFNLDKQNVRTSGQSFGGSGGAQSKGSAASAIRPGRADTFQPHDNLVDEDVVVDDLLGILDDPDNVAKKKLAAQKKSVQPAAQKRVSIEQEDSPFTRSSQEAVSARKSSIRRQEGQQQQQQANVRRTSDDDEYENGFGSAKKGQSIRNPSFAEQDFFSTTLSGAASNTAGNNFYVKSTAQPSQTQNQSSAIPTFELGAGSRRRSRNVSSSQRDSEEDLAQRPMTSQNNNNNLGVSATGAQRGSLDRKNLTSPGFFNSGKDDSGLDNLPNNNTGEIEQYTPGASRRRSQRTLGNTVGGGGGSNKGQGSLPTSGTKPPRQDSRERAFVVESEREDGANIFAVNSNRNQTVQNKQSDASMQSQTPYIRDPTNISNVLRNGGGAPSNNHLDNSMISFEKHQSIIDEKERLLKERLERLEVSQRETRELEEKHRKVVSEKEDEFQIQIKKIKESHDKMLASVRENYESQLAHERSAREKAHQEMFELLKQEKDRMRQVYLAELQEKEAFHRQDKENMRRNFEVQSSALQKQIEQQTQMQLLAEEMRSNSEKLQSITRQLKAEGYAESTLTEDKVRQLREIEEKLNSERELLNAERQRLERLRTDLDTREMALHAENEREKRTIQIEYARLQELQDQLRQHDTRTQKDLFATKLGLESEFKVLEEERRKLRLDYEQKQKDLDTQATIHEQRRLELDERNRQMDAFLKEKMNEIQQLKERTAERDLQVLKKVKLLQLKEREIDLRQHDQLSQEQRLELQRRVLLVAEQQQQFAGQVLKTQKASLRAGERLTQQDNYSQQGVENGTQQDFEEYKSKFEQQMQRLREPVSREGEGAEEVEVPVHTQNNNDVEARFSEGRERFSESSQQRSKDLPLAKNQQAVRPQATFHLDKFMMDIRKYQDRNAEYVQHERQNVLRNY